MTNFLKESNERYLKEEEMEENCPVESEEALMFYESMLTEERVKRLEEFLNSDYMSLCPEYF